MLFYSIYSVLEAWTNVKVLPSCGVSHIILLPPFTSTAELQLVDTDALILTDTYNHGNHGKFSLCNPRKRMTLRTFWHPVPGLVWQASSGFCPRVSVLPPVMSYTSYERLQPYISLNRDKLINSLIWPVDIIISPLALTPVVAMCYKSIVYLLAIKTPNWKGLLSFTMR